MHPLRLCAVAALCAGCACSGPPSSTNGAFSVPFRAAAKANPIEHVVFIVQENRSFNNLFMGYPGATTRSFGYDTTGAKIPLQQIDLATAWDIDHSSRSFFAACDRPTFNGQETLPGTHCKMDGWNNEQASLGHPLNFAYAYVPRSEVDPYWKIAGQYVLADRMFASNLDGSFISHQYTVAAYASHAVDFPLTDWGCEGGKKDVVPTLTAERTYGPNIVACFHNPTIGSEADAAGVSWRFYTGGILDDGGIWSTYQADDKVFRGPDWNANVINPPSQFLADIGAGKLANVTWISPTYGNSDHPGLNANGGPAWVTSLIDAIGTSKYWKTTAIFVMWDDWGGWFDPVKPVHVDYDGLGFRVPLLIVSPYAKKGYVTHVQYETSSVLRFIEDTFGLSHLAASDARANDPATDAFDFNQKPRAFKPFAGARPTEYWMLNDRRRSHRHAKPTSIIGDD